MSFLVATNVVASQPLECRFLNYLIRNLLSLFIFGKAIKQKCSFEIEKIYCIYCSILYGSSLYTRIFWHTGILRYTRILWSTWISQRIEIFWVILRWLRWIYLQCDYLSKWYYTVIRIMEAEDAFYLYVLWGVASTLSDSYTSHKNISYLHGQLSYGP